MTPMTQIGKDRAMQGKTPPAMAAVHKMTPKVRTAALLSKTRSHQAGPLRSQLSEGQPQHPLPPCTDPPPSTSIQEQQGRGRARGARAGLPRPRPAQLPSAGQ